MLLAADLQAMLDVRDREIVLYGYTFLRNSLYVFFYEGKIVRTEHVSIGNDRDWLESHYVHHRIFDSDVKRWYMGAMNDRLKNFMESFGGIVNGTPGGEYTKGELYDPLSMSDYRVVNLDAPLRRT